MQRLQSEWSKQSLGRKTAEAIPEYINKTHSPIFTLITCGATFLFLSLDINFVCFLAKMCISLLEHVVEIIALWMSVFPQRKVVGKGKSGHPCSDFCSYDQDQQQKIDGCL